MKDLKFLIEWERKRYIIPEIVHYNLNLHLNNKKKFQAQANTSLKLCHIILAISVISNM